MEASRATARGGGVERWWWWRKRANINRDGVDVDLKLRSPP